MSCIFLSIPTDHSDAQNDLKETIKKKLIKGKAKNVILFIGDGMGFEVILKFLNKHPKTKKLYLN